MVVFSKETLEKIKNMAKELIKKCLVMMFVLPNGNEINFKVTKPMKMNVVKSYDNNKFLYCILSYEYSKINTNYYNFAKYNILNFMK
jgi:hypothetical protein